MNVYGVLECWNVPVPRSRGGARFRKNVCMHNPLLWQTWELDKLNVWVWERCFHFVAVRLIYNWWRCCLFALVFFVDPLPPTLFSTYLALYDPNMITPFGKLAQVFPFAHVHACMNGQKPFFARATGHKWLNRFMRVEIMLSTEKEGRLSERVTKVRGVSNAPFLLWR